MLRGIVAYHPDICVLLIRAGDMPYVGPEEGVPLCGGPDPLVHLVRDDSVIWDMLYGVGAVQCALPLHAHTAVPEVVTQLVPCYTLHMEHVRRNGACSNKVSLWWNKFNTGNKVTIE